VDHFSKDAVNQTDSGLLGYTFDSPLALLEAKFGRKWALYQPATDVLVNRVMGAMSIDMEKRLSPIKAIIMDKANFDEAAMLKSAFLPAIFDVYQWRMLYFARGDDFKSRVDLVQPNSNNSPKTICDSLISQERPKFAPLHPYLGQDYKARSKKQ
jgi:hypothetical protein